MAKKQKNASIIGFANIYLHKGKPISYHLKESDDGYFITKNNRFYKQISKSTRNWLWAERKFKEVILSEVKTYIKNHPGNFKEVYSNLFFSPNPQYFTQQEMEGMYLRR